MATANPESGAGRAATCPAVLTRSLLICLLGIHAGLLAWMSYRNSPAVDEVGHLAAGLSHWQFGTFDLYDVNPPLVRLIAAAPVSLLAPKMDWSNYRPNPFIRREIPLGREFVARHGEAAFWYFTVARWALIPFSLLGGYVCYRWATDLHGPKAGLVAAAVWSFSPDVLAWGATITPDAAAAALGLTAAYAFWRWLRSPGWQAALAAGLLLGLAELSKMTWIVLFLLWPILWAVWRAAAPRKAATSANPPRLSQLAAILAVALLILNLGYCFSGSMTPLGEYRFLSKVLAGREQLGTETGNRFAGTPVSSIPVPFPRDYVLGLDRQKSGFEQGKRSYLAGRWKDGGWWYYYLYAAAIKIPLGIWCLAALSLVLKDGVGGGRADAHPAAACGPLGQVTARDHIILLAPAATLLIMTSSQTGVNAHFRYLLPALPFCFVGISRVGQVLGSGRPLSGLLVAGALAWAAFSSASCYPHSMSYFNELAGGPSNGHAHLLGSNLDWGQDLIHLKLWIQEHPEARPLKLAYYGSIDPDDVGLTFPTPPPLVARGANGAELSQTPLPEPGWYAISISLVRGMKALNLLKKSDQFPYPFAEGDYSYFQMFEPVDRAGYSIYIYHLTPADIERLRTPVTSLPPTPE